MPGGFFLSKSYDASAIQILPFVAVAILQFHFTLKIGAP